MLLTVEWMPFKFHRMFPLGISDFGNISLKTKWLMENILKSIAFKFDVVVLWVFLMI